MPTPRIGKDVRCWVRATQVRNADDRVDIVAMFGLGNGGARLYGKVVKSIGPQVYSINFDMLPTSIGWDAIQIARKYITTMEESEYMLERGT